jgi:hypothetical protein
MLIRELMAPEIPFIVYEVEFASTGYYDFIENGCGNFTPKVMLFGEINIPWVEPGTYALLDQGTHLIRQLNSGDHLYVVVADSFVIDSYVFDHIEALAAGNEPPDISAINVYAPEYDPGINQCDGEVGRYFDLEISETISPQ